MEPRVGKQVGGGAGSNSRTHEDIRVQEAQAVEALAAQEPEHYPASEAETDYYTVYINVGGMPYCQVTRTGVAAAEVSILHYLHGVYNARGGKKPPQIPGQPTRGFVPFYKPPVFERKGPKITKGDLARKYGTAVCLAVFPLLQDSAFRLPLVFSQPEEVVTSDSSWMSET